MFNQKPSTINITKEDIDELVKMFNDFNTQKAYIIDTITLLDI